MAFQLTIASGKEAGREFSFEQAQVVIGRTDECDIILYDAGISRRHARIFSEGPAFIVEDLGSSNGTRVNGASVKRQVLGDGDTITVGPVTFNFSSLSAAPAGDIAQLDPDDPATRIIDLSLLPKSRNKGVAAVPLNAKSEELRSMGRANTAMIPPVRASGIRSMPVRRSNPGAVPPPVAPPVLNTAPLPAEPTTNPNNELPAPAAAPPGPVPSAPRPPRASMRNLSSVSSPTGQRPSRVSLKNLPPVAAPPVPDLPEESTEPSAKPRAILAAAAGPQDTDAPDLTPARTPLDQGTQPGVQNPVLAKISTDVSAALSPAALGDEPEGPTRMTAIPAPKAAQLSAAERIRLRRDAPALGKLKIAWGELKPSTRRLILGLFALVSVGGTLGGIAVATSGDTDKKPKKVEPTELTQEPLPYAFGVGDRVNFWRTDEKQFTFDLSTPVEALVILHYQCKDITEHEVVVNVNGAEMGWLPADTVISDDQEHELLVPARALKRNQENTVVFDNVNNPPQKDPWKIWNIWVEIAVLPEMDEAALIVDANAKLKRGLDMWEHRTIGASNTWTAYKNFREAWLWLEALPAPNRPPAYEMALQKMRDASKELDERCTEILRQARTARNFKRYDEANSILNHVPDIFPSKAHPCQSRADAEREELEL